MQVTYRPLLIDEFDRARPLFERLFPSQPYPTPEVASVIVAEIEGEIVGFWFIQLCAHAEPAGVDPKFKDIVSMNKLLETLHLTLSASGAGGMVYYIHTETSEWDKALQSIGFKPLGFAYNNIVPQENNDAK